MADRQFIPGMFAKRNPNAPDYVVAKLSMRVDELIPYLQAKASQGEQWVNVDVKRSKSDKLYVAENTWKPDPTRGGRPAPMQTQAPQQPQQPPQSVLHDMDDPMNEIPF